MENTRLRKGENHMSTITTLNVNGMSCSHCEKAVKEALNQIEGVFNTAVNLEEKTVIVQYDDLLITEKVLKEAIEDVGYDVV